MKILFLSHYFYPHIGGVEKHTLEVSRSLIKKGHKVTVLTEKYQKDLKIEETNGGIQIIRFRYSHIKFFGLFSIWIWLFKNRKLILNANIVHCHDVFIWYLPFRFLYPTKKVYTTLHGWEGVWPIPWQNIFLKQIANKLSEGSIAVGRYIEKYYKIKTNKVVYGATSTSTTPIKKKIKNNIVWLGRLEKDTGLPEFLKWLKNSKSKFKVDFVGDGSLKDDCEKYGKVQGFVNPEPFLQQAEYCVPGGYLSYIEAIQYGCKIKVFPNNPLKKDYWKEIQKISKFPTWDQLANEYINLYNNI